MQLPSWLTLSRRARRNRRRLPLVPAIESLEDRVHHLITLRQAQDEAIQNHHPGRFQTLVALPFVPDGSRRPGVPYRSSIRQR